MSDNPHRPAPPARPDGLVETGNPAFDPRSVPEFDQSTVANARAPTVPNTDIVPDVPGYAVVEKIGEGGMGAVFLATDTRIRRKVAIKTMKPALAADPGNRARFFREAGLAAGVEHDNIVPVLHVGEAADGTPFIAMPFLQGEPLDVRLKRESKAPLGLILKVGAEVADGLAAAHAQNLIHRDIKPGNVWLEGEPGSAEPARRVRRCKILDFGLARSVDTDDPHGTASGMILGTPAYMAPEQARGERVDHRADLFSLGVMLYRMATGRQPFRGDTAMSVLIALTTETPDPVRALAPDLPPDLLALIERLMYKDAGVRLASAAEVAATCRAIAAREPDALARVRSAPNYSAAEGPTASFPQLAPPRTLRDRLAELAGTVALAPVITAACVAPWLAVQPSAPWTLLARTFLLATALAWAVALVGQIPACDGWRRWARYAVQFALGAGVGVLALWCDGWAGPAEGADGHDLALPGGLRVGRDTAWVGVQYAVYFGLAVCACRWWRAWLAAPRRPGEREPFQLSWGSLRAPLLLLALLVAWPNQFAPLGLAVLILVAALVAQVARRLSRVPAVA